MRQTFVYDFHLNLTVKLLLLYTIETYCLYFEIHIIFVMVIAIFNVVLIFENISFVCAFVLVTENRSLKKREKGGGSFPQVPVGHGRFLVDLIINFFPLNLLV